MAENRTSGILLHISSLPSRYGIGDFGPEAHKFVEFLKDSGQSCWQILPLNHTAARSGHSPYDCLSAFAGNPLLISPEMMYREGLLEKRQLDESPAFDAAKVDYKKVFSWKSKLFAAAFERRGNLPETDKYRQFAEENQFWLRDFALFMVLRRHFEKTPWNRWPEQLRDRKSEALDSIATELKEQIDREIFLQYIFYMQYGELKSHCAQNGIRIIGDIPIYVAYDSADVWSNPGLFKLDKEKNPKYIAGVPPDYFSRTGQLWGNPVYNWRRLEKTNYDWWMRRMGHNLGLFDVVRLDHFRGMVAYWQVPGSEKTAENGKWVKTSEGFFPALLEQFPRTAIIAEDLGHITPDVRKAIEDYGFPCMRVLQFAFDGNAANNPHYPHNHIKNSLVYTGTHDNNTTRGWFEAEAEAKKKRRLFDYLGREVSEQNVHWEMIRLAMASVAGTAVIPMQDVLGLPSEARMNRPAKRRGNWLWRMEEGRTTDALAQELKAMVRTYGRI